MQALNQILFKDGLQFLLKYEPHHLKEFFLPFSKLLKARCGNEGFYQFVLGSICLLWFFS
jgi:hypothetical protein